MSDGSEYDGSEKEEEEPEYDLSMVDTLTPAANSFGSIVGYFSSPNTQDSLAVELRSLLQFCVFVPDVVTKYKAAGEITNKTEFGEVQNLLNFVAATAYRTESTLEAHTVRSPLLGGHSELAKAFNKKNAKGEKVEKSIAFPTCISCNVVSVKGKLSSVFAFRCNEAADAVVRMMKPGCKNSEIAGVLEKIGEAYNVKVCGHLRPVSSAALAVSPEPSSQTIHQCVDANTVEMVDGTLSHQMKRFVIDGNKVVLNKPTPESKVEDCTFEENENAACRHAIIAQEGCLKQGLNFTVLDQSVSTIRYLRSTLHTPPVRASRFVFSEINKKFPTMPFSMRNIEDSGRAKLGLVECLNHELLHPYPVLHEKAGDIVAHVKATVLIMPNGVDRMAIGRVCGENPGTGSGALKPLEKRL
eukprot:1193121-Prorocentrum_minimum.AAC.2